MKKTRGRKSRATVPLKKKKYGNLPKEIHERTSAKSKLVLSKKFNIVLCWLRRKQT
jgi:hypothetical protein